MDHCHIIFRFLFPTDKNTSVSVEPAMCAFDDPSPNFIPSLTFQIRRFLPATSDMKRIFEFLGKINHFIPDIASVKTKMLSMIRFDFRTIDGNALGRRPCQFYVVSVGSIHSEPDWNSTLIGQNTPLNADFSAIGRISPRLFPPRAVILSSLHPSIATASRFPFFRHKQGVRFSIVFGKIRLPSIVEIVDAPLRTSIFPLLITHSIGTPFWRQKEWHRIPFGHRLVAVRPLADDGFRELEYVVLSLPKFRPILYMDSA